MADRLFCLAGRADLCRLFRAVPKKASQISAKAVGTVTPALQCEYQPIRGQPRR
jgi:hypothetical protein